MVVEIEGKRRLIELYREKGNSKQSFNLDLIVSVMSDERGTIIELINGKEYLIPVDYEIVVAMIEGYNIPFDEEEENLKLSKVK